MTRLRVVHAAKFYPPARGGMERVVASNESALTVAERVGGVSVLRAARFGDVQSVPACRWLAT